MLTAVVATAPVFLTAVVVWPHTAPPLAALAVWSGLRGRRAAGVLGKVASAAVVAAVVSLLLPTRAVALAMAMIAFGRGRRAPPGHRVFARLGLGLACWTLVHALTVAVWAMSTSDPSCDPPHRRGPADGAPRPPW